MAKEAYYDGNNFNGGKEPTTYLNYAGLLALWSKIKTYVDANDNAVAAAAKNKFDAIDGRLDGIDNTLENGIVSGLIVDVNHGTYPTTTTDEETGESVTKDMEKAWVSVTQVGTPGKPGVGDEPGTPDAFEVGNITIQIDDTVLNNKIKDIDEEINNLVVNAGVTNIAVSDVNSGSENLVTITLAGTKGPQNVDHEYSDGAQSGDILITLDESALDEKIEKIEKSIEALASATHFRGVIVGISKGDQELDFATELKDGVAVDKVKIKKGTSDESLQPIDGDIFITSAVAGSKEFIFYSGALYELGDTTAENDRISALETWVDSSTIKENDIDDLFDGLFDADGNAIANEFEF